MSQKQILLFALAPAWASLHGCTPVTDTGQTTTTTTTTTTAQTAPTSVPSEDARAATPPSTARAFTPPPAASNLNAQATKAPAKTRPKTLGKTPTKTPTKAPVKTPTQAPTKAPPKTPTQKPQTNTPGVRMLENGLKIEDIKVGTGATVKSGDSVTVNYRGALTDGTVFDESAKHGGPISFTLGQVIEGWNIGMLGMKEGGKRKLTIPGALAYGPTPPPGSGIPPDATLIFDIELVKVG